MSLGIKIQVDKHLPPETILFISPREVLVPERITRDGVIPAIFETEEAWGKRCGMITGVKP